MPCHTTKPDSSTGSKAPRRLDWVDALRGVAVGLMIVYHVAWDLDYFRFVRVALFTDPFWLGMRAFIPGLFLALSGLSLVLARRRGFRARPFWCRVGLLILCAVAITVASYVAFPRSFIFFGIIHSIALASLLAQGFMTLPAWTAVAGAAICFAAPHFLAHPFFDQAWLQWVGLMTYFPDTNDYVPVFPWFGAVLLGLALGRWLESRDGTPHLDAWRARGPIPRLTAAAGRHALPIYMMHQPALLGVLYLVSWSMY